jgi:hypothetical protein
MQGALEVDEERVAADAGEQPDRAGLDEPGGGVEADRIEAVSIWPAGSGWRAWGPVAYQAVPVWVPCSNWEKVKLNATSACASASVSRLIR